MQTTTHDAGDRHANAHCGGHTSKIGGKLVHVGPEGESSAVLLDVETVETLLTGTRGPPEVALLDVEAVAALLSCSTRTARRMADAGQMPRPVKIASLVRWRARTGDPMTGVMDWIESGCPSCRTSSRRPGR